MTREVEEEEKREKKKSDASALPKTSTMPNPSPLDAPTIYKNLISNKLLILWGGALSTNAASMPLNTKELFRLQPKYKQLGWPSKRSPLSARYRAGKRPCFSFVEVTPVACEDRCAWVYLGMEHFVKVFAQHCGLSQSQYWHLHLLSSIALGPLLGVLYLLFFGKRGLRRPPAAASPKLSLWVSSDGRLIARPSQ